jgi:homogentisate 1,2-dioxygenase
MPIYHTLGEVPPKRHCVFENPDGGIYYEHLIGNLGFTGCSSLLYSIRRPTQVLRTSLRESQPWNTDPDKTLRMRHFRTHSLSPPGPSPVLDRTPMLFNDDVAISICHPSSDDAFFYRNAMGDEIVFITEGEGVLESEMGELPFRSGDYLVIPRGILHRFRLEGPQIHLIIESRGHVRTPKRYRNEHGQLLEHSPFCERDIRRPGRLPINDEQGEFPTVVKKGNALHDVILDHHPFDIVGWDGYYYPWAFNIEDLEPIVGRVHQPPPVHQTFEGDGFVICSFVPRLFDFHPRAVPAPYNHSNVMTDEVLYYANDEFMSRKGISYGSITLHPDGLPHGPQPGKIEESIGAKETKELAVMIDTFKPLLVRHAALEVEDEGYGESWLES